MKTFAALFDQLDQTTSSNAKVAALAAYFRSAPDGDKLWTIALLSGRRPKRTVPAARLRDWAAALAGLPRWLVEDCHPIVGDLAETIALILPEALPDPGDTAIPGLDGTALPGPEADLADWIALLQRLPGLDDPAKRRILHSAWARLPPAERFVFNKLITGGFRMGVSQKLMTRALAAATGQEEASLAHRLMGAWEPGTTNFEALVLADDPTADLSRPYPFSLASPLEETPQTLGARSDWLAEWKWDGIRGQLIARGGALYLWSRGEELITDRFPEFAALAQVLPAGTVMDGEIVAWDAGEAGAPEAQPELPLDDAPSGGTAPGRAPIPGLPGAPLPFAALQRRIGRKTVPRKLLQDAPARFLAYDLLEDDGTDLRDNPLSIRRHRLEARLTALPSDLPISVSPLVTAPDWDGLAQARQHARAWQAEGLMLKRGAAPYRGGRHRGDWWKWKLDPFTVDAVMVYAQSGHGRRANLFTDFTFAVPDAAGALVPFTKAYSGLTDAEFRQITAWVQKNTLQRFGPVRQVPPEQVFEIAFEGIQRSPRHKSGLALRFPRMVRWRHDKPVAEINCLADLEAMVDQV